MPQKSKSIISLENTDYLKIEDIVANNAVTCCKVKYVLEDPYLLLVGNMIFTGTVSDVSNLTLTLTEATWILKGTSGVSISSIWKTLEDLSISCFELGTTEVNPNVVQFAIRIPSEIARKYRLRTYGRDATTTN
jgi:hypothetical protein